MKKFDSAKWITENKYGKISEIEKDPDAQVAAPKKGEKGEKEKAPLDAAAITNQTSYGELSGEEDAKKILTQLQSRDPNQPIYKAMVFKDKEGKTVNPDPEKIASDIKKTGIGFQNLSKKIKNTKYTGVDPEFESGTKKGRIGTGTAMNPEVVTNGRANKAKNITNYKDPVEPSSFAKSRKEVSNFAKKNPVAAFATYDIGKGIVGKIMNIKGAVPGVRGGTVGRRSARGGGGL